MANGTKGEIWKSWGNPEEEYVVTGMGEVTMVKRVLTIRVMTTTQRVAETR